MEKYENMLKRSPCRKFLYDKLIGAFEINLLLYNYEFHFLIGQFSNLFSYLTSCSVYLAATPLSPPPHHP